jgi:uncharacterized protein DUF2313
MSYLVYNTPWHYSEDDFVQQVFTAWEGELEQFARWTQFEDSSALLNVLNGLNLYTHEGVLAQWFVRTTSGQGLQWWEEMLGVSTDTTLSDSARRNNLLSRMKQRIASPTTDFLLNVVQQYVTQAVITLDTAHYAFTITVTNPRAALPTTTQNSIIAAVEAAKPAHLAYTLKFTETSWNTLAARDWNTIGSTSWATLSY